MESPFFIHIGIYFNMKIIRIITGLVLVFCILFTCFYGQFKIAESQDAKPIEYRGVLKMWQIDGFEGGAGSRKQFLLKVARGFERENDGVLIMVSDYTLAGAEENLKNGIYPDLISYSNGLEITGACEICPERETLSGMVGEKSYATAWCRGGYVLISNPQLTDQIYPNTPVDNLLVSQGEYTQPLTALVLEGVEVKSMDVKKPMDAYVKFVLGKTPYFLATQRDLVRLQNRGMNYNAYPLTVFNDLYQYVSVTSNDLIKQVYAQKFVNYLLTEKVQSLLTEIKMFSPHIKVNYQEQSYVDMQSVSARTGISAFNSKEQLKELQRISALSLNGESEYINKIKNMLV